MPLIVQAAADAVLQRCAQEAERDVDDMKKAQYMERYVGNAYVGKVSGVTPSFGLFVELENTIEKMVHISSMKDDRYQYHEEALCFDRGTYATVYRMGDEVKVRCVAANRWKRQIDFELLAPSKRKWKKRAEEKPAKENHFRKRRQKGRLRKRR